MTKINILIVLVLYKTQLEDSLTYSSLRLNRKKLSWARTELIIFNNSPEIKIPECDDCKIITAQKNEKLYGAYSHALKYAENNGFEWLMLLDQDTKLSEKYFDELKNFFHESYDNAISAVVPTLYNDGMFLSPHTYHSSIGPMWCKKEVKKGKVDKYINAFNSGAVLNVRAMNSIGGFPKEFPLDALDTCYLYRLKKKGYDFFVLPVDMTQRLSVLDYTTMTEERYTGLIKADNLLAKEMGINAVFFLKIRMLCRCIKFATNKYKRKYIGLTLKNLI